MVWVTNRLCPECGSDAVHHSRTRGLLERVRRLFTSRAPFRCHECDWRGWRGEADTSTPTGPREIHKNLTDAELDRIDSTRREHGRAR